MGGTEILSPIEASINLKLKKQNRIFLLTDGEVQNAEEIVTFIKENNHLARVHTFGIGSGCD